jgi:hypothetical protein
MEDTNSSHQFSGPLNRGRKWKISGASLVLITLCIMGWTLSTDHEFGIFIPALLFGTPVLIGRWLYRRGMRMDATRAETVLATDHRPPVLYLRTFGDDGTVAPASAGFSNLWRGDEEEQIAAAMSEIGPFIAIGKPGEPLPELGASRTYQTDETWRDWVSDMMGRAQLVLFRAGTTEGHWWEVGEAVRKVKPERVAILLPFGPAKYNKFRERAQQYFPGPLPDHPGKPKSIWTRPLSGVEEDAGTLQAVLYFDRNWNPHIEAIKLPFYLRQASPGGGSWVPMYAYVAPPPVTFLVKRALNPVLEQLSLTWARPPRNRVALALLLTGTLALIPFLFLSIFR